MLTAISNSGLLFSCHLDGKLSRPFMWFPLETILIIFIEIDFGTTLCNFYVVMYLTILFFFMYVFYLQFMSSKIFCSTPICFVVDFELLFQLTAKTKTNYTATSGDRCSVWTTNSDDRCSVWTTNNTLIVIACVCVQLCIFSEQRTHLHIAFRKVRKNNTLTQIANQLTV